MTPVVGFDPQTAEKLLQLARNSKSSPAESFSFPGQEVRNMDAGTAQTTISARTGSTPGSGRVQSAFRTNQNGNNHTYGVYNIFDSAVDAGTWCVWTRLASGIWIIIAADC